MYVKTLIARTPVYVIYQIDSDTDHTMYFRNQPPLALTHNGGAGNVELPLPAINTACHLKKGRVVVRVPNNVGDCMETSIP